MGNKKLQVWLPLIFSIVLIGGMYFGFRLRENTSTGTGFFKADKKTALQEILDLVKERYVDAVSTDSLQETAIDQMMNRLDPHSRYIPPSHLKAEIEDLEGIFDGIGVEFNIFSDTVHVVHVIAGGPSDKAGLQVGDKIIKVNNDVIAGKGLSSDDIKSKIRGESSSTVKITVIRKNLQKEFPVKRGKIPVPAVDAAYLLNKTTGYIKLNKFTNTAYEEFMRSLEELQKNKITNLVLDLRGNGGGLMGEAVDIADEFLSNDKLVVYTQGANVPKEEYKCRRPGLFEQGGLVILVDELSASASEVLAGALQDWCRADIVGRRTFGKGLVQKQYGLSDGGALRLTIARYYTPKGRSIQRAYDQGKEKYLEEIRDRYENGDPIHPDTSKLLNGKVYTTQCGDSVYGGGGITPKFLVGRDTSSLDKNAALLYQNGVMSSFIYNYYISHLDEINKFSTPEEFITKFNNEEARWQELIKHAAKENIDITQIPQVDKDFIQRIMKAQLARYRWRSEGYYEALNSFDPVVIKAIDVLSKQKANAK